MLRWPLARRVVYPIVGAFLALGAPGGLILVRAIHTRRWPGLELLLQQVNGEPLLYSYLTISTTAVFVALGIVLGRDADRLAAESVTDLLTGLANRRRFEHELARAVQEARPGEPLSVLLFDLDYLKAINDGGGHHAGDAALRTLGASLAAACRTTDLVARLGGDEFAILAPNTSVDDAVAVAERVREALAQAATPRVTVSVGVAGSPGAGTGRELLACADAALYRAKELGRDRVVRGRSPP